MAKRQLPKEEGVPGNGRLDGDWTSKGDPVKMQKKIFKASPMGFWHLMLEFEDGTKQMVHRGDLERQDAKPGDIWPPDGHEHVTESPQADALRKKA